MAFIEGVGETTIRLVAFLTVLVVMAILEHVRPRRPLSQPRARRWLTNLAIVALDSVIVRLMASLAVPLAAVAAAIYANSHGMGLLALVSWPWWVEALITILVLDFAVWMQHLASHKIPLLWRLHQVHHADVDIDVTTALRFHPIEIALSMLWKIVCVLAIGPPPEAVVLFEILLNASAMFNHSNVALPGWLDTLLRAVVVTPDMHRVHHSTLRREHDSNYGFNLSVWDRICRTYTKAPEKGHLGMTIGLAEHQSAAPTGLVWSLLLPFRAMRSGD